MAMTVIISLVLLDIDVFFKTKETLLSKNHVELWLSLLHAEVLLDPAFLLVGSFPDVVDMIRRHNDSATMYDVVYCLLLSSLLTHVVFFCLVTD